MQDNLPGILSPLSPSVVIQTYLGGTRSRGQKGKAIFSFSKIRLMAFPFRPREGLIKFLFARKNQLL